MLEVFTATGAKKVSHAGAAENITIEDTDGHYSATNVEDALAETATQAEAATTGVALAARGDLKDGGFSSSTTPGTRICFIEASSGYHLVSLLIAAGHNALANRQLSIVITYTDATTTTINSTSNTNVAYFGGSAGLMLVDHTTPNTGFEAITLAKNIKSVEIKTLGTGTGNRFGALTALEKLI